MTQGEKSLTCQETPWSVLKRSLPSEGGDATRLSRLLRMPHPPQSVDSRVLHSFLFLSLVTEPDPHHILFKVQFLSDGCDLLR